MTSTAHREIERKYEGTQGSRLPDWSALIPAVTVATSDQHLQARYFDTAELHLAAAGITLRHRTGDDVAGWHLKVPLGTDTREEIRVRSRAATSPPKELLALTRAIARGRPVAVVATLTTERRLHQLRDEGGRHLVEVTEDRVTAICGDDPTPRQWSEVEVELGPDGDPKLLERIEAALRKTGVRRSGSMSKLGRALGDRVPDRTVIPAPTPKTRAGEVVLAYLSEQLTALAIGDLGVRRDQPDSVHQMRVASRRLRSTLQAYGELLERSATRAVTDELKWIAAVLGEDRDLEVLRARVSDAVAAQPVEFVLGPVSARVATWFAPRQAEARARVIIALDGDRYVALLGALDELLRTPPTTSLARRPARVALPQVLSRQYRRVQRNLAAVDTHRGAERDIALHEGRKAAKRLRYAAEVAEPALGKAARRLRTRAEDLQTVLGEHQDGVVALPVYRELALAAHAEGENGFTFGRLQGLEESRAGIDEKALVAARRRLERVAD